MTRTTALACVLILSAACARKPPPEPPLTLPEVSAVREFAVPWENAFPSDVAVDSAGRVWFADRLVHGIGVLDPETGEFRSYPSPTPRSAPYAILAGPDGGIWFSQSGVGALARLDPLNGAVEEYPLEGVRGGPHLLTWRDGEIWFGVREARSFGRFDPRTGQARIYVLERDRPYSLTATSDAVWIGVYGAFRMLEVDPQSGAVRVHDLAEVPVAPFGGEAGREPRRRWQGEVRRMVAGDGGIWFTDFVRNRVVWYDPVAPALRSFESLEPGGTYGLARSRRGLLWYASRDLVTVLNPHTGDRRRVPLPTAPDSYVRTIVLDEARGRVWLSLSDAGRLGLIEYR
jgi:streptogramin lyase